MQETERRANDSARCEAMNARGGRCGKRAVRGRFCLVHAGAQDMTALGHAGGKASVRRRLGLDPEVADGRLRKKAKRRLEEMLDSEDEAKRLAAARSLYSYSPARAPSNEDDPPTTDSVKALKVILTRLSALPERELVDMLDVECFKLLGRVAKHDPELMLAAERFTERLAELTGRRGPDLRSPVSSTPIARNLDTPTPKSDQGPSSAPPVPPLTPEERKRAAELAAAKADWKERDATPEPQEYRW